MDYYNVVSKDSYVSRVVDGLVMLIIGLSIGVVLSQVLSVVTVDYNLVSNNSRVENSGSYVSNDYGIDVPRGYTLEEN